VIGLVEAPTGSWACIFAGLRKLMTFAQRCDISMSNHPRHPYPDYSPELEHLLNNDLNVIHAVRHNQSKRESLRHKMQKQQESKSDFLICWGVSSYPFYNNNCPLVPFFMNKIFYNIILSKIIYQCILFPYTYNIIFGLNS